MILKFWVKHFRSLKERVIILNPFIPVFIYGQNNQGKTSLLEAIYCLSEGRAPEDKDISHLIHHHKPYTLLGAEFKNKDTAETDRIYVKLTKTGDRAIQLNEKSVKTFRTIRKLLSIYYLSADVIRLFQGYSDIRRRYIDKSMDINLNYIKYLKRYNILIKQRNVLLKRVGKRTSLSLWNNQLCEYAAILIKHRLTFLSHISCRLKAYLLECDILHFDSLNIVYRAKNIAGWKGDPGSYKGILHSHLDKNCDREYLQGSSLYGPHRDDFEVLINNKSLRIFFSRGINRVISLLLQISLIPEKSVLLLDDTFSEIDSDIKEKLIQRIFPKFQVIYTSVVQSDCSFFKKVQYFHMKEGVLIDSDH